MESKLQMYNGRPTLFVDGKPTPAHAYTTYFEENNRYADFIEAGYKQYFINISFTTSAINSCITGFTPFNSGVFEDMAHPDYSEFETAVGQILALCPDAQIFPRIYVSMPKWWVEAHPDACVDTPKGGRREALFCKVFREDGSKLLRQLVAHIQNAPYWPNVAGWQLCGGHTQEWYVHDMKGSFCPAAQEEYAAWAKAHYGIENAQLPTLADYAYQGQLQCTDENAIRYAKFCNDEVARSLEHFAKVLKEATDYRQIVGAFYGYAYEVRNQLHGAHGLRLLLDSPYLDFFSTPNAYTQNRELGIDWGDMLPVESVKLHGKLSFIENDIRTYLTKSVQQSRPGRYPADIYPKKRDNVPTVFAGPATRELSVEAIRKSFCHQLCRASAVWWFDMFGGWYHDPVLMETLVEIREIMEAAQAPALPMAADVIFFADELAHANICLESPAFRALVDSRLAMGNTGVPYDAYMVEDAQKVLAGYKAAVFPSPIPSEAGKKAMALCEQMGIPYLTTTPENHTLTTEQIVAFLRGTAVHFYCDTRDVIYAGNGYLAIHAATAGKKHLRLPFACEAEQLFGPEGKQTSPEELTLEMPLYATALFRLNQGKKVGS